jgi:type I restriction enzyme S subunit
MTNWKEYKLDDIILSRNQGVNTTTEKVVYSDFGYKVLRAKNISDYIVDKNDVVFVNENTFLKLKDSVKPKNGDILFTNIGSQLGSAAKWKFDEQMVIAWNVLRITVDESQTNSNFLVYLLNSNKSLIKNLDSSSTMPFVSGKVLGGIKFNLPNLPTQTAIAEILSSLDDKIELNNKINSSLENLAQTLFKQWFIDFEFPFDFAQGKPNENGEPYKSSGGEMVDSELGEIPKGWGFGSIYDISDVIYGAPFKSKLFNQENKGLPLIRIRDLKTFQPQNWTEEIHPKGTKIYAGDLVVGMDAEFRAHFWLGQPAWLNQRLCHFRPKIGFSKLFVREIIRPQLAFHENSSVGTTVIHLGKGDIDTFKSLIPINSILLQFEELSNSIFDSITNNSKETQELTNLRDTLLPKLISGLLEVNDL